MTREAERRPAFFGPLPTRGIWTALDLTRAQFFFVLGLSILLFVFIDGPVWMHERDSHFWRIGVSYAAIPIAAAAALYQNGKARLAAILVASAVIALIKLVLTAGLVVVIGLAKH